MTTITQLPTPPSTNDSANFNTRADAFLGALPKFADELNAFGKRVVKEVGEAAKQKVDELIKSDEILGEVKIKIHALPRNSARRAKQREFCKWWKFRQWTLSL